MIPNSRTQTGARQKQKSLAHQPRLAVTLRQNGHTYTPSCSSRMDSSHPRHTSSRLHAHGGTARLPHSKQIAHSISPAHDFFQYAAP